MARRGEKGGGGGEIRCLPMIQILVLFHSFIYILLFFFCCFVVVVFFVGTGSFVWLVIGFVFPHSDLLTD